MKNFSVEDCKSCLISTGNVSELLKPATIARILGMMARTHNDVQVNKMTDLIEIHSKLKKII